MLRSELFSGHIYRRESKKKWQGILFYVDPDGKRRQKTKLFNEKKREPAFSLSPGKTNSAKRRGS